MSTGGDELLRGLAAATGPCMLARLNEGQRTSQNKEARCGYWHDSAPGVTLPMHHVPWSSVPLRALPAASNSSPQALSTGRAGGLLIHACDKHAADMRQARAGQNSLMRCEQACLVCRLALHQARLGRHCLRLDLSRAMHSRACMTCCTSGCLIGDRSPHAPGRVLGLRQLPSVISCFSHGTAPPAARP